MLSSRIDRAFRRYLRTRDPSALGRVFDAVAPELYRLAWHLTGDRHVAEDLVQTTFLVALQDGGSFETDDAADGRRGRVVPWLYGILTNRVLDWRRQAKRRAAPAPDGFDVANDDPAAGAAARELRDDVARAIRVLPEPYRQVLLLHLVHELAPKEIAEALARPAATVRVQLRRGLELLRRGLPAGVAGLARAAMPVPVGLAIVRERVLANVAAEVGAVSMTAAGSGIVFGGLLAMKKLVAFAALLVAGLVLWTVWPRGEIAPRSVEGGLRADPAAAASEPASLPADRGGDSALAREAVDPPPAADATAGVELLVRWHDGTPAANVTVRCLPRASTNAIASADDAVDRDDSLRETVGRTGGDGVVRFVGLYAPRVRLTADRGGDVEIELVRGSIQRGVLDLSRGYDVTGRVVDLDDRPIAGATVWLSVAEESDDSEAVATSAADGRFEIRSVGGDRRMLTATAPGFGCAKVDWVSAERATRVRLLRLRPVPGSLVLTVVDHDGAPIAGAHVLVGVTMSRSDGSHHRIVGQVIGQDHWPSRFGRTDDLGVFHAEGLPPLSWPIWVGAPGHAPVYRVLDIADAGVTRATLQLTEGARVHGRVIDAEGRPAAGALVGLRGESGAVDYVIGLGMEHVFGPPFWARAATRAGDDGRFLLERAMAGTAMLHANDNVAHVAVPIELAPGQVVERDLCFGETRLRARGRIVDEHGGPFPGWLVHCASVEPPGPERSFGTNRDGEFKVVEEGLFRIAVSPASPALGPMRSLGEHRLGSDSLDLVVPRSALPRGSLQGRLVLADGTPVTAGTLRILGSDRRRQERCTLAPDGTYTSPPLGDDRYRVELESTKLGRHVVAEVDVADGAAVDVGTFYVAVPGRLEITVVDERGQVKPDVWVHCVTSEQLWSGAWLEQNEGHVTGVAPPGRYSVQTSGDAVVAAVEVEVQSGVTTRARLVAPDGVPIELRIPTAIPLGSRLVWRDERGRLVREERIQSEAAFRATTRRAPPGRYTLELRSPDGRSVTAELTLEAGWRDNPVVVELALTDPVATPAEKK